MAALSVIDATVAPESTDLALVARARRGDAQAFERLLEPRFWRLGRLAWSITGNQADADDAIQIGCLQAWRELPATARAGAVRRLALAHRHQLVSERRPRSAPAVGPRDRGPRRRTGRSSVGAGPAPDDALPDNDAIRRAFARLEHDKRTILVLHHVDDRSITEIAGILGIPEGTAKWRLHAARQALERALEAEER